MTESEFIPQFAMQGPIYRRMLDFSRDYGCGIRCITTPTGSGKTYVAAKLFAETFFSSPDVRMVYVVPLRENRNSFGLECLAAARAEGHSEEDIARLSDAILVVKSQIDCLLDIYGDRTRWPELGARIAQMKKRAISDNFGKLDEALDKYTRLQKALSMAKADNLIQQCIYDVSFRLKNLKDASCKELRSEFLEHRKANPDGVLPLLEYYQLHRDAWGWMEQLWPSIQIPSKRIFILTPEKLLGPEDTVISGSFSWVNPKNALGGSPIAVLDEGDSIKSNFLDSLADNAAKGEIDPFNFLSKFHAVAASWLEDADVLEGGGIPAFSRTVDSKITTNTWHYAVDPQKTLDGMVRLLRAAKKELYVDCSYRIVDTPDCKSSAFMFPGFFSTIGFDGIGRYRVLPRSTDSKDTRSIKNHIVYGSTSQKSESLQLLVTRAVRMDTVIFMDLFRLALLYQHNVKMQEDANFETPSSRKQDFDPITVEHAISSVVNELFYGLHRNGNGYTALSRAIMNQFGGSMKTVSDTDDLGVGLNIWGRGDSVLQLGNSPFNNTKSEVLMNSMSVTPERVLARIGKSYRCIMMSASLGIDSPNNFEFRHFLDHLPGLAVVHDTPVQQEEIKALQDSINDQTGRCVACEVHIVGIRQSHASNVPMVLTPNSPEVGPVYRNGRYLRKAWDSLCSEYCPAGRKDSPLYAATKLWNLAEVMYECIGRSSIHSVLCIVERSLGSEGIFSLDNARRLLEAACREKGLSNEEMHRYHVFYLNAANWHEMMDEADSNPGMVAQCLQSGDTVFLVTTGSNAEAGKNIQRYLVPSQKDDYVCIYPDSAGGGEAPIRCDWDAIYREKPTNDYVTDIRPEDGDNNAERISMLHKGIYEWTSQYDRDEIDRRELMKNLRILLNRAFSPSAQNSKGYSISLQGNESLGNIYAMHLIQSLGRLERTSMRPKTCLVFIDCDLADAVNTDAAKSLPVGYLYSRTMQCIKEYQAGQLGDAAGADGGEKRLKRAFIRTTNYCTDWIERRLRSAQKRGYWTKSEADDWAAIRKMLLAHPSGNEPPAGIDFYWHSEGWTFSGYCCRAKTVGGMQHDIGASVIGDAEVWIAPEDGQTNDVQTILHPASRPNGWPSETITEDSCRLSLVNKVPLLKEWWNSKHYALHFAEGEYHMPPVMAKNIYRGALGEECLQAAVSSIIAERGMKLSMGPMPTELTEKFDFALYRSDSDNLEQPPLSGIYFDAKNWNDSFDFRDEEASKAIAHVEEKLSECSGSHAVIVNIFGNLDEEYAEVGPLTRGCVTTIPMLWGYHGAEGESSQLERYTRGWLKLIEILEMGEKC